MTLKEKLKTEFPINTELKSKKFANKCVLIADEFAIEFAEWMIYMYKEGILYHSHSNKELLKIYKKENGL